MTTWIPELCAIARCRGLSVLVVVLVNVGCAAPAGDRSQVPSGSGISTPSASVTPTAPAPTSSPPPPTLVLRVEDTGGLAPPDWLSANFPAFSLLGDGRVILPAAPTDILSGPALPAIQVRQLNEAGLQAVLDVVSASGQFAASAEWRGADTFVFDAGTTVFTLNSEGRAVTITVYALQTFPLGEALPDLPPAELAAQLALDQLIEKLTSLDTWMPASAWAQPTWQPYLPDTIRLFARNADADPPDDSGANQEWPWPTERDATWIDYPESDDWGIFRCRIATGDDAQVWYAALSTANQPTRFVADGQRLQVSVRLLLPDEPAECPPVY